MSNDSDLKQVQGSSSYNYNYGGNYAGYSEVGYGYSGDATGGQVQRTFQDYLLILRERIWYIVVVFLVVFSSSLVYTLSDTRIYQASSTVQIFRRDPTIMQVQQVVDTDIRSAEDLNTQIKVIESDTIVQMVAERIKGDDLNKFLAPYERSTADLNYVMTQLKKNRKIIPQRLTLVVNIAFQHPDRMVAAKVANLFADAYLEHNTLLRMSMSTKAVDDLKETINLQRRQVDQLATEIQAYKEKNNMVSLDSRKDIVNEALKTVSADATKAEQTLNVANIRLKQVQERRASGGDLSELSFIASQPSIIELSKELAKQKILLAQLEKRYKGKHPEMIKAQNQLAENQSELKKAIDQIAAQIEAEQQAAQRNYEQGMQLLEKRTEESLQLDRLALEYNKRERELKTQEALLQTIIARQTETSMSSNFATQNARIVDKAVPPPEDKPISPNVPLNLGLGVVGGLGLGLAFAFFVAFIDDRVKSSFDIEGVVGLPLIGIIPQVKRMDQPDKATVVVNNADRQVSEAFLTLHSSLRLKDESKNAKCILTTSTIPGEGKSFISTNLALTFAAHGEKVIIVDCDLRKPNIHKSFRLENLKGVIDVCANKATLDDVVLRNVHPNLDVLPAGGRAKNPTQILNSKSFEQMLSDLRKRYDRVFIDTPPLAAVSDALIVLPLVDGSIFTIFFNKVRRKAAQFAAKKLQEANVPNFGAVLNGLNLAVSGYYYAQYYDKSYKDYYVVMSKSDGEDEAR
ncbi:MAG: polysaccharide biosynthesis tyrosine autokinase [Opitutaceae bacterium]|nr:polysaccharide biosynthesis tyrosine autokinase [Opitutaceae bacterium]